MAESALGQSAVLVQAIRGTALEAEKPNLAKETRQSLQNDINNSLIQLDKIARDTLFNEQQLLSGTFAGKEVPVGPDSDETIKLSIASAAANKLGSPTLGQLPEINVLSQKSAQAAIKIADAALGQIDASRADIDSTQKQLASAVNHLAATGSNLLAATSAMTDVDLAEEALNFTTMKMLTEANSFALAQAKNMNKQNVLSLLQG